MKLTHYQTINGMIGFLLAALLLSGCSRNEGQVVAATERPAKVVPVAIETVAPSDLMETFTLPASLEAWEDLTLAAEIAGPVRQLKFQEGDRVAAGTVLLEIDPETLRSNLVREEENYAVTTRKVRRYRDLAAEGLVSQQELDELENSLTAAEAGLRATRLQLAKSYPKAPVSGVVDRLYIDRGEYIELGKPLLRLVQVDKLKVIVDVPEKDVPFLQVGQEVEILPAVINNRPVETVRGTIDHIAFSADSSTRTYRTKIVIDNSAGQLRPGMIVRAKFIRQQLPQVISAPLYAVLDRDGEKLVFVAEAGAARKVPVKIGSSVGERLVIAAGLTPGQQLIVQGQQLLTDGALVQTGEN